MNGWDLNAERRRRQITSGIDLSYAHVLTPAILKSLPKPDGRVWSRLLDAGCGTGALAERLWGVGWRVTGIDKSPAMVEIARRDSGERDGLVFLEADFSQLPTLFGAGAFDVVVTNMSLTGVTDLRPSLRALRKVVRRRGRLVLTDVHPWFWRQYKGHTELTYWDTVGLAEPLAISLDPAPLPAPVQVVYRPLHELCEAVTEAGFLIQRVAEPRPPADIEAQYPQPWRYPRFILVVAGTR